MCLPSLSVSMQILVISLCCFAVDGYEIYKGLKRTC